MQINKSLFQKVKVFLPKGFVLVGVLSLLLALPLTASAKEVIIWELDNFFSVEGGTSPDGVRTEFNIEKGDTLKFINMGATDHDAGNQLFTVDGQTFFDKDLFGGAAQSPGDEFATDPIDIEGEIPFICFIHGEADMAGTLFVSGDEPEPSPTPTPPTNGKSFTFNCDREFEKGLAGVEILNMEVGETIGCTLQVLDSQGQSVEVAFLERALFPRRNSPVSVDPGSTFTNPDGSIQLNITADSVGIAFTEWAVPRDDGEIGFGKDYINSGHAWGMFIRVAR